MASKHISILKSFTDGNAQKWFQRCEICTTANEWADAKQVDVVLPLKTRHCADIL